MSSLAPQRRPVQETTRPQRPSRDPSPSGTVAVRRPDVALLLSHDLKTPLSTIAMNLEYVMGELPALSPELRSALDDCIAANARAVRIVSDMAEAARVSRGEPAVSESTVDVQLLLGEAVRNLQIQVGERRAHILRRGEPTLTHADPLLLGRAIERLLEWTLRHALAGATLELTCVDRVASMRVKTCGPMGSAGGPHASLATHYADAVLRSQGGGVWSEVDVDDMLCVTVAIPQ